MCCMFTTVLLRALNVRAALQWPSQILVAAKVNRLLVYLFQMSKLNFNAMMNTTQQISARVQICLSITFCCPLSAWHPILFPKDWKRELWVQIRSVAVHFSQRLEAEWIWGRKLKVAKPPILRPRGCIGRMKLMCSKIGSSVILGKKN